MTMCVRCAAEPHPFKNLPGISSDPRKCAFADDTPDALFRSDNWNCATVNLLRPDDGRGVWSEDQWAALIPLDGRFLALSWYKHRGRTEGAWVISSDAMYPATRAHIEEAIAAHATGPAEGK